MYKMKQPSSLSSATLPRAYFVLLFLGIIAILYWFLPLNSASQSSSQHGLADVSRLPHSSLFTYANISSQIHFSETQGVLFVSPNDGPVHFASIKSGAVRGNHRHSDSTNSISGEVIILLQGQFQFRINDGKSSNYEDHLFDICSTGIVALEFTADKCHALKNIGTQTNWFTSYYIRPSKSKEISIPTVDKQGCNQVVLI